MHSLKILLKLFLVALSSLAVTSNAHAGAWLQQEGQGELIINYTIFSSDEVFDESGDRQSSSNFAKNEFNPYFEYGLADEITIGGSVSYQSVISEGNLTQSDSLRFSFFDVFARTYLFNNDDFVVSIEPRLHVPVNADASLNPEGNDPIPELKLSLGAPFKLWNQYSFVDVSGTYRFRDEDSLGNELKDILKLEGSLGLKVEEDVLLLGQIFHEQSLNRQTGDNTPGNFDLTKLQLSIAYDYWETVFLQVGAFTNIDGVNTSAGNGLLFSAWYKF